MTSKRPGLAPGDSPLDGRSRRVGRGSSRDVTFSHKTLVLSLNHRHPRCLALTSSPRIYSNYSHRGHHSPTSARSARILTVSQKNPSLALPNSLNNCGKQQPQVCSALGMHPIWRMARNPLSPMPRKPDAKFAGRSGKSEERINSKSQRTFVVLSLSSLSSTQPTLSLLLRQAF